MVKGSAPAMLNTPRSFAALSLSGSTCVTSARSTAKYTPKPRPLMAMPTRKPLTSVAAASTKSARPYTIDADRTKTFRRPVRSDSRPPASEARTTRADWTSAPRKICCGTSASAAELVQQVVGLVRRQEGVRQDQQEATGEGPREVRALPGVDVEGGRELAERPPRLGGPREPAVVEN